MAMPPQMFGRTKNVGKRSKKYVEEALYRNLFKEGGSEPVVRKQLNDFLKSSKRAFKWEVGHTVKKLRDRDLFSPALKLSEIMAKRGMGKTVSDQAIHLDLLAKARGIPAVENYFVDLPDASKNLLTYGALLNSYCKKLMREEAEALFEKMKELNLGVSSMSYNSLMTLYVNVGQPERVPGVVQEMKGNDVELDCFTYNIWMRALAAANDIYGVERVIDDMKRDGRFVADWTVYSNLASIYVDAGMFDKAGLALKELERVNARRDLTAFQFLITLYGRIGNVQELYRVWRSLRLAFPKTANVSYLNMIQALVNLNDLPGAEKCFKEWQSTCTTFDIRIANVLMALYAKQGSIEKAEALTTRARWKGAKPNAKTWEIFMNFHFQNGDAKKAVECLANAISTGRSNGQKWVPSADVVASFMAHFEQEKDVDGAEGFIEVLKKAVDGLGVEVFESLIRTYAGAGKTNPLMRRRLKMEKAEVSEASQRLLQAVCPE